VFKGDDNWANIKVPAGQRYAWDMRSTYVKTHRTSTAWT